MPDVAFHPLTETRPLTDVEEKALFPTIHWTPQSLPISVGETVQASVIDGSGRVLLVMSLTWLSFDPVKIVTGAAEPTPAWLSTAAQPSKATGAKAAKTVAAAPFVPNSHTVRFELTVDNRSTCTFFPSTELQDANGFPSQYLGVEDLFVSLIGASPGRKWRTKSLPLIYTSNDPRLILQLGGPYATSPLTQCRTEDEKKEKAKAGSYREPDITPVDESKSSASQATTAAGAFASCSGSDELSQITDPKVNAIIKTPSEYAVQVLSAVRAGGGLQAVDQNIASFEQLKQNSLDALASLSQTIALTGGSGDTTTQEECSSIGPGASAHFAALCERLNRTNTLHWAQGSLEILRCIKANWQ